MEAEDRIFNEIRPEDKDQEVDMVSALSIKSLTGVSIDKAVEALKSNNHDYNEAVNWINKNNPKGELRDE